MKLKITTHSKTGKLEGFHSLNTSIENNPYCQAMRKKETICKRCFGATMLKMYKNMEKNVRHNLKLLSEGLIPAEDLPIFNDLYFRLHSVGELLNDLHFINFLRIAAVNPKVHFSLWTKKKLIVNRVLRTNRRPENLKFIYSSPKINVQSKLPANFDKVFTVYDKKYAAENNIKINCGGKKCKDCMLCYKDNDVVYINEILK